MTKDKDIAYRKHFTHIESQFPFTQMFPRFMTSDYSTDSLRLRLWKEQKKHKQNCFQRQQIMLKLQSLIEESEK